MDNKTPNNWISYKISDLCEFQNGYAFSSKDYTDNGVPIVRMSNISINGTLNLNKDNTKYYSSTELKNVEKYILKKNDIVMAMTDMTKDMGILGKTAIIDEDNKYLLNQRVGRLIIKRNDILDYKYLHRYTNSPLFLNYAKQQCSGGVQLNLSTKSILNHEMVLPPTIEEQREIAKVLDVMSEIIRLREECIKHAQDLIPAIFQEMFGDSNNNVSNSKIVRLGECIELNPAKPSIANNLNVTFLGMKDISENGQVDLSTTKTYEEVKKGFTNFENDDVLLAKITPCFENGKAAIVRNLTNRYGFGSTEFYVLRANQNIILPEYVYSVIKSFAFAIPGRQKMTGAAGQKRLPKSYILNYKIPLPNLELQIQYAEKLNEINSYIKEQQEERENAKQMFQSLLHHAFTGKLTSFTRVDLLTKQLVLHAKIIDKCNMQPTFGAVKLEKIFNICDMVQDLNLAPNGYYRKAAGPYIPEMRYAVEEELEQRQWVKIGNNKNRTRVEYKKDVHFSEYKNLYSKIFGNKLNGIENIIQYFINKDTDYCEAFSTLYMCWNDLLIEGKNPSKFEIIDEFKNHWAPEKQRFDRIYLLEILSDISNNNFEPKGKGLHTINSDYNINKNQLKLQLN